jgi:branched-chain amino acid transport system permease protein
MSVGTRTTKQPSHSREASAGAPGDVPRRRLRLPRQTLLRHLVIALALGAGLLVVSLLLDPFDDLQLATAAYYFPAVAGLTVLTGLNGQVSLGHGALMAVGAYSLALLTGRAGWALVPGLVGATAITAVVGVLVGAVAARLRGPYLAGTTLAFAVALPALADRYPGAFGGENGLTVDPPIPPSALGESFPLERWQAWITCAASLIVLVVLANLVRGRLGRAFRAVRDDEVAAQLSGIDVARTRIVAFVVSAACAGLGGALLVVVTQVAAPGAFQLSLSLALVTGIVLGGLGSLAGAAWGALALVLLPRWLNDVSDAFSFSNDVQSNLPLALYGLVLMALIIRAPAGIQGAVSRIARWAWAKARRPSPSSIPREEGAR